MIKRLYVHNFRCLENFELPISQRASTLLIGKNGAGKSTVSSVLEIFQSIGRGTNGVKYLIKSSDFSRGRTEVPMRFEINVKIGSNDYQYTLAFEFPDGFREARVLEENLTVDDKPLYSRKGANVTLLRSNKDKEANFQMDWHLVVLPVIQEQSKTDPLYLFKTWLAQMLILSPIPRLMTGESQEETLLPNRLAANIGDWFSGLIAQSPAVYTKIDKYLRAVMPDFWDIKNPTIGTDARRMLVQFRQDQGRLSLPFHELSDGEKCFVLCALVLAANEAYGPLFCFWDEPDNYLSPNEVGHFVLDLRRSFQDGSQLIVTSHNVEAIRKFSEENTLLLHRRSHLEPTIVRSLSDFDINGDIGDVLIRGDLEL